MQLYHTTREGHRLAIAQMVDSHLINTILLILRRMQESTDFLTTPAPTDPLTKVLYGKDNQKRTEVAESTLVELYGLLAPYCLEASIRGLMGPEGPIVPKLQKAVNRIEALPGGLPSLQPSGVGAPPDVDQDDDDWEPELRNYDF